jgi:ketosteroid isomerase-like protein
MSQENLKLVRSMFAAFNAGDMDAFGDGYDPDVIWRLADGWPEPGPYVGRDAVMRYIDQLRDTWDADTLEPIGEFIDAADRVVVRFAWRAVGHGPESNIEFTGVFTIRKGKVTVTEYFWDHAEVLDMLGLQG